MKKGPFVFYFWSKEALLFFTKFHQNPSTRFSINMLRTNTQKEETNVIGPPEKFPGPINK